MPDYNAISNRVLGAFQKAGAAMTLTRTTEGTYDPTAGAFATGTTADYTVYGLIQARSLYQTGAVGQNFFNGILVLTDDQFIILEAASLAIVPIAGDVITIVGVAYTIMTVIPVRPGGTTIMYRALARK